jgi:hypothetical protein
MFLQIGRGENDEGLATLQTLNCSFFLLKLIMASAIKEL